MSGAMLIAVAACGGNDAKSSTQVDANAIISVDNTEPQSPLIPSDTNEMGGGKVIRYLFEGLVSFDAKGKQHMEVAKSITPNSDASQYTIKLNDGWKFTNGEAVTANSFAKAWSYAANIKHAQKQASRMSVIKGYDELQNTSVADDAQLSGLDVQDDLTLVVTLNHPDSVFPTRIAHQSFFPLPSVAYKDMKAFGKSPIGDGPYKFKEWDVDKSITVVKNPDYKGSRTVKNGGIEFRVYTSPDAAYSDVQAGNLDVQAQVPQSAVKTFTSDSSVQAYSQAGSSFQGFIIPQRLKHFGANEEGQLRRQAISLAIDRDQIIEKVYVTIGPRVFRQS
jgi:peptide/nickel transport system substrate-binding protein/oligopeptide transport system substrate-binding protein